MKAIDQTLTRLLSPDLNKTLPASEEERRKSCSTEFKTPRMILEGMGITIPPKPKSATP